MINEALKNQALKDSEKLRTSIPMGALMQKLKNASPEERKQMEEIAKKTSSYMREKNFKGALKFLDHIKKQK